MTNQELNAKVHELLRRIKDKVSVASACCQTNVLFAEESNPASKNKEDLLKDFDEAIRRCKTADVAIMAADQAWRELKTILRDDYHIEG